jgi:hypothetical protein
LVTWLRVFFIKSTTPRYHSTRHFNKHGAAQQVQALSGHEHNDIEASEVGNPLASTTVSDDDSEYESVTGSGDEH